MLNVLFYLRGIDKCTELSKELVITCQLCLEGQPRDTAFSLKIRVPKQYWWTVIGKPSPSGEWVDSAYYNATFINKRLQSTEQTLRNIVDVLPLLYPDDTITYNHIRRHYDPDSAKIVKATERKVSPFLEMIYTEFLENKIQKREIKTLTQKSYRSRINNVYEFFGRAKRIDGIRHRELDKFESWLGTQENKDGSLKFCRNYRNKH